MSFPRIEYLLDNHQDEYNSAGCLKRRKSDIDIDIVEDNYEQVSLQCSYGRILTHAPVPLYSSVQLCVRMVWCV